jgi:molecular chaperone Hsp33
MTDRLIRGYFPAHDIRFALCQAADLCSEAVGRHQADWMAAWLLSEALVSATLMSVNLKQREKFTLRWIYPGPVGTILADTNESAEVRGFPQRLRLMDEAPTLGRAMGGEGRLSAITSLPNRVIHTGITAGVFMSIPRDMAHLLSLSFQIESSMNVGLILPPQAPISLRSALGVLIQPLPGADPEAFARFRRRVDDDAFRAWLEQAPHALETVLERIAGEDGAGVVLDEASPRFVCHCSREKVASVLRMFEPAELQDMIVQDGQAAVNCHFCATSYHFSKSELEMMLGQSQSGHA